MRIWRVSVLFVCVVLSTVSCAVGKNLAFKPVNGDYEVRPISEGLPVHGSWQQNVVLYDVNGDGFVDILAPPPRIATDKETKKPAIFVWDNAHRRWTRSSHKFPDSIDYDFGAIAVGDINNDGLFDIVLAVHKGRIVTLINDGKDGFVEKPVQLPQRPFHSRAVKLVDLNRDGWLDIVAVSEYAFVQGYVPAGILVALNKQGAGWESTIVEGGDGIFADSIDVSTLNKEGQRHIFIAPLIGDARFHKVVWTTDDAKRFTAKSVSGLVLPFAVKACDVDGDGNDEIMVIDSGLGLKASVLLKVFKISRDSITDISEGLPKTGRVYAVGCADFDGNGKKKAVMFTSSGLEIWGYKGGIFEREHLHGMDLKDVDGMYSLDIGRNKDGSWFVVCNFPFESVATKGLRAFSIKK